MDDPVQVLRQLGFAEYEARAYVGLLRRNPLTGYELARLSGVPRADIYDVLRRLEDRGAVVRVDAEGGVRYAPVSPDELIARLHSRYHDLIEDARRTLAQLRAPAEHEYVWNTRGYPVLIDHARSLVRSAHVELLVGVYPPEARAIGPDLAGAEGRGVAVTTVCFAGCPEECGACRGRVYRYRVLPGEPGRWLLVIPDQAEVLVGEITGDQEAVAVRTRQRLLVDLAGWYLRNTIALAAVVADLDVRLDGLLRPETRAILRTLGPRERAADLLGYLRGLLGRGSGARPDEGV